MKNRFLFLPVFISVVFFSCKTKQVVQKETPKKPVTVQTPAEKKAEKPKEITKVSKQMNIALLLPLYLEQNFEIDTSNSEVDMEPRSLPALSFYEGARLAIDSLNQSGIKVKLDVFDTSSDSSAKRAIVLKYQSLKNYDLVYATFPSSQANIAADEAKLLGIKMVLTQFGNSAALQSNSNIVLASPSTITQCKLMADYIVNEYHYSNFMILVRKIKKENDLADVFKKETDSLLVNKYKSENKITTVYYNDSIAPGLLKYLSADKRNILFLPSSDESYVSSVLNAIDTLKQKITVVGLPTWENFETVQYNKFLNLEIYIFSNSYLDYNDTETKNFRKKFIDHYKIDPLFNAYQGFTLTHYFTKLFNSYDKNFIEHVSDNSMNAPFKFVQTEKQSGHENTSISILKYSDYQLLKVNKTD
jgi:ABC-type branched-subunit amino acid transport system substrate-binding protein